MRSAVLFCLVTAAAGPVSAQPSLSWNFDDPAGTLLEAAAGERAWSEGFAKSACTGTGAYRIQRGAETNANAYVAIPFKEDHMLLSVEIAGWKFKGQANEVFRAGLVHSLGSKTPSVTAQIKLERRDDGVYAGAEAFPAADTQSVEAVKIGGIEQDTPVTLLLEYRAKDHVFVLYRKNADDPVELIGTGRASPSRKAAYIRLGVAGTYDTAKSEFLDLAHISLGVKR